jgi:hypothetical protein
MAEAEFHDPERINLLEGLQTALKHTVSSTIRAYLWLSDIDNLRRFVDDARRDDLLVELVFEFLENRGKIVQKCECINFCTFS